MARGVLKIDAGLFIHADEAAPPPTRMHSRVDAASTSDENRKHWANADALGPNAALDPATRAKLRNRGRYESLNNSYCRGLVRTLANDLIGTGPRLQLTIPGVNGKANTEAAKLIRRRFSKWSRGAKLGLKFRIAEKCAARDGEAFFVLTDNERLRGPVKLDLRPFEAEQCTSPMQMIADPMMVDGIKFDKDWNPVQYYFLRQHPGEKPSMIADRAGFFVASAEQVLHWYEQDRPGQMRGIPKITASLPLFAQMRRFTLASLTSAEFAAMLSGVMKTNLPPGSGEAQKVENWELWEMVRGTLLTLPEGWAAEQFRSETPTSTYPEFKREILNEAGRGAGAPLNIVTGNSSGYNFSSGRLDHLPYHRGLTIDRDDFRTVILDPVFLAWHQEAAMIGDYLPADLPPIDDWDWSWNYDGFDSIDQNKDAMADDTRLKNGTSTYAEIFNAYGQDLEEQFAQLAYEKELAESLGLPWPVLSAPASAASGDDASRPADQSTPEDDSSEPPPTRRGPKPSHNGHANGYAGRLS